MPPAATDSDIGVSSIERPLPELMPVVAQDDPPPPAPKPLAPERVPSIEELPAGAPKHRADYSAWWKGLSAHERHAVTLFCRANPVEPEQVCGGIGPLHVPPPPSLFVKMKGRGEDEVATDDVDSSVHMDRHDWELSLTGEQRRWVDTTCEVHYNEGELCLVDTPLVLSFDRGAVQYTHDVAFFASATDWPTAATPWLAIARDGVITSAELFGSATPLANGFAADGFQALAALDANHDGLIDARDPMFARLVLWRDRDGDARASAGELEPASATVISISLAATATHRCDARDNCEGLTSTMIWRDAHGDRHEGSVIDVYLPPR